MFVLLFALLEQSPFAARARHYNRLSSNGSTFSETRNNGPNNKNKNNSNGNSNGHNGSKRFESVYWGHSSPAVGEGETPVSGNSSRRSTRPDEARTPLPVQHRARVTGLEVAGDCRAGLRMGIGAGTGIGRGWGGGFFDTMSGSFCSSTGDGGGGGRGFVVGSDCGLSPVEHDSCRGRRRKGDDDDVAGGETVVVGDRGEGVAAASASRRGKGGFTADPVSFLSSPSSSMPSLVEMARSSGGCRDSAIAFSSSPLLSGKFGGAGSGGKGSVAPLSSSSSFHVDVPRGGGASGAMLRPSLQVRGTVPGGGGLETGEGKSGGKLLHATAAPAPATRTSATRNDRAGGERAGASRNVVPSPPALNDPRSRPVAEVARAAPKPRDGPGRRCRTGKTMHDGARGGWVDDDVKVEVDVGVDASPKSKGAGSGRKLDGATAFSSAQRRNGKQIQ